MQRVAGSAPAAEGLMNTGSGCTPRSARDRGFTLVEVLVTIVILGVLASVTTMAVRGITSRGEDSVCVTDRQTLRSAIEVYFVHNDPDVIPGSNATDRMAALVAAGSLVEPSPRFTIDPDGALTPVGACADS